MTRRGVKVPETSQVVLQAKEPVAAARLAPQNL